METLIVGGGIAGISIAARLDERGNGFQLVDSGQMPSSTEIATGMYNPVVFRRVNLSWMIDDLLPELKSFYATLETQLNIELDQPIDFYKKVPSADYAQLWEKRREEPQLKPYIGKIEDGWAPVQKAGMIDCKKLVAAYREHLAEERRSMDSAFDHSKLSVEADHIDYDGKPFERIIFCEGAHGATNPFFSWLPFNLCQGEWIIIEADLDLDKRVLNNKTNIIPMGDNRYKLSSTYSWNELDWKPKKEAKAELLEDFRSLYDIEARVVDHQAALRPTVADRRPYLGAHPEHKRVFIFNGLGSKGLMLAPWFSKHLIEHLFDDVPLMDEVNIERHIKRYINRE